MVRSTHNARNSTAHGVRLTQQILLHYGRNRNARESVTSFPRGSLRERSHDVLAVGEGEESRGEELVLSEAERIPPPSKRIHSIATLICAPLSGFRREDTPGATHRQSHSPSASDSNAKAERGGSGGTNRQSSPRLHPITPPETHLTIPPRVWNNGYGQHCRCPGSFTIRHSETANPPKGGDAKLWV